MKHKLKTWPVFFWDVATGGKTFEIRKNDRDFKVGDQLILQEYDPDKKEYTGTEYSVMVDYTICLDELPGIPEKLIGMSVTPKATNR